MPCCFVFRCSVMTAVNTLDELFGVIVLDWMQPAVDCYQLQAFKLTMMTISDYTVLIIQYAWRTWQVVK